MIFQLLEAILQGCNVLRLVIEDGALAFFIDVDAVDAAVQGDRTALPGKRPFGLEFAEFEAPTLQFTLVGPIDIDRHHLSPARVIAEGRSAFREFALEHIVRYPRHQGCALLECDLLAAYR